jgi:hypothetical protein
VVYTVVQSPNTVHLAIRFQHRANNACVGVWNIGNGRWNNSHEFYLLMNVAWASAAMGVLLFGVGLVKGVIQIALPSQEQVNSLSCFGVECVVMAQRHYFNVLNV